MPEEVAECRPAARASLMGQQGWASRRPRQASRASSAETPMRARRRGASPSGRRQGSTNLIFMLPICRPCPVARPTTAAVSRRARDGVLSAAGYAPAACGRLSRRPRARRGVRGAVRCASQKSQGTAFRPDNKLAVDGQPGQDQGPADAYGAPDGPDGRPCSFGSWARRGRQWESTLRQTKLAAGPTDSLLA